MPVCRPTSTTLPSPYGLVSTSSYVNLGTPSTQKVRVETPGPDGSPDWSESYFDGFGRTYKTVKRGPSAAESIVSESTFDLRGNVASSTAPYYANGTPVVTTFQYDALNRNVKTTLPDGNFRTTRYTGLTTEGLFPTVSTNERAQAVTSLSDVLGRTRRTEQATTAYGNLATTREYDILGRMTSLKDPQNNEWTWAYDTFGRITTKDDPDAGVWDYAYDDAGRLIAQTDAKDQTTTLEYDTAGRMVAKRIRPTGGVSGAITESVETTYGTSAALFNKGRVTQMVTKNGAGVEQNGKLVFEYDALGRVKKQTRTIDGTSYIVEKNVDNAGYLRGIKYPDNDVVGKFGATGTDLGYDQAGRLSSIPGILSSVTYNALGAPLVQTNANGTTTTKTYDAERFWLTDIDTSAPGGVALQQLSYTLNESGMAVAVDSNNVNEQWTYEYDPDLNFLKSSVNGPAPGTANNQTWSYDSLGRFTGNSQVGTTFTYPSAGQARPHAPTSISGGPLGTLNFSYDANGNLSTGNGRTMTWDAANRITQVVKGASTTTFTYGPDGTRIKKVSGSQVALYPFGDDYEINDSTVTKYFSAGFGPTAKKVGTTLYWLHADRLGSINAVTDNGGAQVLRQSFRSYGELFGKTGNHKESLDYIGERTDSETGLTYLHARYYDPILGTFLSPDPIGADSNSYRYSFGDSVNFSDPGGLQADACVTGTPEDCPRFWDTVTVSAGLGALSAIADGVSSISSGARSIILQMLLGGGTTTGGPATGDGYQGRGRCTGPCSAGGGPDPEPTPVATPTPTPKVTGAGGTTLGVSVGGAAELGAGKTGAAAQMNVTVLVSLCHFEIQVSKGYRILDAAYTVPASRGYPDTDGVDVGESIAGVSVSKGFSLVGSNVGDPSRLWGPGMSTNKTFLFMNFSGSESRDRYGPLGIYSVGSGLGASSSRYPTQTDPKFRLDNPFCK